MKRANEIAGLIMEGHSLTDCNLNELQQMVNSYPWFVPAQVLLAAKMKQENPGDSETIIDRFSLFVSNPLWLRNILDTEENPVTNTAKQTIEPVYSDAPVNAEEEPPTTVEEVVIQTPGSNLNADHAPQTAQEYDVVGTTDQPFNSQLIEPLNGFDEKAAPTEFQQKLNDISELPLEDEDNDEMIIENNRDSSLPELEIRMPGLKIVPIDPSKAELSFEPYHTVDYFASQGIKVKEEEKPKDRFSEQLKSFTDWLKTIKKVPVAEIAVTTTNSDEKKVEQMAEKSITDREVVTEAMAEVWEKQGDHQKAREIYNKLSLLDPSKSSYFAAKIDQLKHS